MRTSATFMGKYNFIFLSAIFLTVNMATKQKEMWKVMEATLPRNTVISISDIYDAVENNINLTTDDMVSSSAQSSDPRWKRNVRNILQNRKTTSRIIWLRDGNYFLPSSSDPFDLNTIIPQKSRNPMSKEIFDRLQKRRVEIGNEGEKHVMEEEKRLLESQGRSDLANRVKQISLTEVGAGYDILSFYPDGSNKYIEVKSSLTSREIFDWTINEIETAKRLSVSYWLYLVRDLGGTTRIIAINNPASKIGTDIVIKPSSYISELR